MVFGHPSPQIQPAPPCPCSYAQSAIPGKFRYERPDSQFDLPPFVEVQSPLDTKNVEVRSLPIAEGPIFAPSEQLPVIELIGGPGELAEAEIAFARNARSAEEEKKTPVNVDKMVSPNEPSRALGMYYMSVETVPSTRPIGDRPPKLFEQMKSKNVADEQQRQFTAFVQDMLEQQIDSILREQEEEEWQQVMELKQQMEASTRKLNNADAAPSKQARKKAFLRRLHEEKDRLDLMRSEVNSYIEELEKEDKVVAGVVAVQKDEVPVTENNAEKKTEARAVEMTSETTPKPSKPTEGFPVMEAISATYVRTSTEPMDITKL